RLSLIFDLLKKELQYILHHIIVANLRNTKKFCIYSHYSIGAPFEFGFALFEAFDTPVSAAFQNTNQFSKSSQSIVKISAVQSIIFPAAGAPGIS
ncbi:MAG: hypothetical protein WC721_20925, partial [Victivallaceae bacterium]